MLARESNNFSSRATIPRTLSTYLASLSTNERRMYHWKEDKEVEIYSRQIKARYQKTVDASAKWEGDHFCNLIEVLTAIAHDSTRIVSSSNLSEILPCRNMGDVKFSSLPDVAFNEKLNKIHQQLKDLKRVHFYHHSTSDGSSSSESSLDSSDLSLNESNTSSNNVSKSQSTTINQLKVIEQSQSKPSKQTARYSPHFLEDDSSSYLSLGEVQISRSHDISSELSLGEIGLEDSVVIAGHTTVDVTVTPGQSSALKTCSSLLPHDTHQFVSCAELFQQGGTKGKSSLLAQSSQALIISSTIENTSILKSDFAAEVLVNIEKTPKKHGLFCRIKRMFRRRGCKPF